MTYTIGLERGDINLPILMPIYAQHYAEMQARMEGEGHRVPPFNLQVDRYVPLWRDGSLLNFVARKGIDPVGYANVYLAVDMHSGEPIAQEDSLYVLPEHRNGLGRKITLAVLDELRRRGIRRAYVSAAADPRAEHLWRRMGFKNAATQMIYHF